MIHANVLTECLVETHYNLIEHEGHHPIIPHHIIISLVPSIHYLGLVRNGIATFFAFRLVPLPFLLPLALIRLYSRPDDFGLSKKETIPSAKSDFFEPYQYHHHPAHTNIDTYTYIRSS
jgi:hypothetical protein